MAAAGSETFESLVRAERGRVVRICRSILGDEHLGADAAQDTFVRLWRRAHGEGVPRQVRGWLARAAVSASLDLARRRRSRDDALRLVREHEPASAPPASDAAARSELEDALRDAVAELPEGQRTVFLLRHDGGLNLAEAAAALGIAHSTAKTQFARACLRVQTRLRPHLRPNQDDA